MHQGAQGVQELTRSARRRVGVLYARLKLDLAGPGVPGATRREQRDSAYMAERCRRGRQILKPWGLAVVKGANAAGGARNLAPRLGPSVGVTAQAQVSQSSRITRDETPLTPETRQLLLVCSGWALCCLCCPCPVMPGMHCPWLLSF